MSQSASTSGIEDFKKALLDCPSGLREIQAKLKGQKEALEDRHRSEGSQDDEFEVRKKKILSMQKRIESLRREVGKLKQDNQARGKHIINFNQFIKQREDSISNIENIEKTIAENATKKVSLIERRYGFLRKIELPEVQANV